MSAPYFVAAGVQENTHRIHGPGLAFSEETRGAIVFEDADEAKIKLICAALCCAFRAGVRDNQADARGVFGLPK